MKTPLFSQKSLKFSAFSLLKEGIISKINISGENSSNLKASLNIVQSSDVPLSEETHFDFFLKVGCFAKNELINFGGLIRFFLQKKTKI